MPLVNQVEENSTCTFSVIPGAFLQTKRIAIIATAATWKNMAYVRHCTRNTVHLHADEDDGNHWNTFSPIYRTECWLTAFGCPSASVARSFLRYPVPLGQRSKKRRDNNLGNLGNFRGYQDSARGCPVINFSVRTSSVVCSLRMQRPENVDNVQTIRETKPRTLRDCELTFGRRYHACFSGLPRRPISVCVFHVAATEFSFYYQAVCLQCFVKNENRK